MRWLAQELKGKGLLNFSAIVEDDALCWPASSGEGQEDALQQALKVETDLWAGPICSVGPEGAQVRDGSQRSYL